MMRTFAEAARTPTFDTVVKTFYYATVIIVMKLICEGHHDRDSAKTADRLIDIQVQQIG